MISIEYIHKLLDVYNQLCRPLCQQTGIPQTSLDILMFLKNNPQYKTAADIVKIRGIKANLVSLHVERLVQEGYLERREVPGDRRKTELICTRKERSMSGDRDVRFKKHLSKPYFPVCLRSPERFLNR